MYKRYFRMKDPKCRLEQVEWIEMTGREFYRFVNSPEGQGRHFIDMDDVVLEASETEARSFRTEQNHSYYIQTQEEGWSTLSLYAIEDKNGCSGEEAVVDEAQDVETEVMKRTESAALRRALEHLDSKSYQMIHALYLADTRKTEREGDCMIYINGDTHGGFQRFSTDNFPQQKQMSRGDYAIITGDFGGVWDDSPREAYWLDWLEEKPFTTLFVDGNHENFDMLNTFPVYEWQGGKVHYVRPHVLHLMRGQVFEIDGITLFTMGGAASHDIQDGILDPTSPDFEQEYWFKRRMRQIFRVKGASWWPEELPSEEEYEEAVRNLKRVNWKVDCILTHCAPTSIQQKLDQNYTPDRLTDFLQMVKRRCQFDYWFLGHYHRNCVVDDRFIVQWEQMVELQWE